MQEYHDGILLFEVSNNEVWDKASKDTAGLAAFFDRNKDQYNWEKPHFKGKVIRCKSEEVLNAARQIVATQAPDSIDKMLKSLNDSVINVRVEKGLYVQGDNKWVDKYIFKQNVNAEESSDLPFVFVTGTLLESPEEYTDVRGLVTADYQEYLEKEWISALREKYPVEINKKVLKTVREN